MNKGSSKKPVGSGTRLLNGDIGVYKVYFGASWGVALNVTYLWGSTRMYLACRVGDCNLGQFLLNGQAAVYIVLESNPRIFGMSRN